MLSAKNTVSSVPLVPETSNLVEIISRMVSVYYTISAMDNRLSEKNARLVSYAPLSPVDDGVGQPFESSIAGLPYITALNEAILAVEGKLSELAKTVSITETI